MAGETGKDPSEELGVQFGDIAEEYRNAGSDISLTTLKVNAFTTFAAADRQAAAGRFTEADMLYARANFLIGATMLAHMLDPVTPT